MAVTLGIDVGTFETKGVAVEDGAVIAEARRAHDMIVPRPGWAEHDPEAVWWGEVAAVARELMAALGDRRPEALAVSAIGPCCLAVDEAGTPVSPGILYGVDTRASVEIAELTERIGAEAVLARAGTALTSQAVGPKALWLRKNRPDAWGRAARLHTATSFTVERLTGAHVMDHYTAGSWAPLYDIAAQDWGDDLFGICDRAMLPALRWTGEVAGRVTAKAAVETHLPEGLPVTVGTIDAGAEALSVGVAGPGDLMIMYGSTIYMIAVAAERVADPRLWVSPWLFPGLWTAQAGLATSGTLTQWLRGLLLPDAPRDAAFAALAEEAAASPEGARGLVMLPYLSGERTPLHDPEARGVVFGLDLTHTRGDLFRAALEGVAAATRHAVETMREAGAAPVRTVAVGGGTKNAVWLQATSDMAGLDQIVPTVTTGAAYGDAFLAACAVGAASPGDIAAWNPAARTVAARAVPAYDRHWRVFRGLYDRTRDLMGARGDQPGRPRSVPGRVGQQHHVLAHRLARHEPQPRPGAVEHRHAPAQHHGMHVDAVAVDEPRVPERPGDLGAAHVDLPLHLRFQPPRGIRKVPRDQRGVGPDPGQRARGDPLGLRPPRLGEGALRVVPALLLLVPVAHDLVEFSTIEAPRQPPRLLDEVPEQLGARREAVVLHVAVERLVHAEDEGGHAGHS